MKLGVDTAILHDRALPEPLDVIADTGAGITGRKTNRLMPEQSLVSLGGHGAADASLGPVEGLRDAAGVDQASAARHV